MQSSFRAACSFVTETLSEREPLLALAESMNGFNGPSAAFSNDGSGHMFGP
jgi:hypothetical protein